MAQPAQVEIESDLPWQGRVRIALSPTEITAFDLHLRIPSWAGSYNLTINSQPYEPAAQPRGQTLNEEPASGYAPQRAYYRTLSRRWSAGDVVELEFAMPIVARRAHRRVKSVRGRVALTRGPLVYCLESIDNPSLDIFQAPLDTSSLQQKRKDDLLGGIWTLVGQTPQGQAVTAIPYSYWANRGQSQMAVWLKSHTG